tara:strand:- start:492 stop:716 length:225 start_codon:yes stop_codon:yes gene_type:complete
MLGFKTGGIFGEPACLALLVRNTNSIFPEQLESGRSVMKIHGWVVYLYLNDVDALTEEQKSWALEIARCPEDAP